MSGDLPLRLSNQAGAPAHVSGARLTLIVPPSRPRCIAPRLFARLRVQPSKEGSSNAFALVETKSSHVNANTPYRTAQFALNSVTGSWSSYSITENRMGRSDDSCGGMTV